MSIPLLLLYLHLWFHVINTLYEPINKQCNIYNVGWIVDSINLSHTLYVVFDIKCFFFNTSVNPIYTVNILTQKLINLYLLTS